MDREEILKRAQSQSIGLDEREQQMLGVSFGFGAVLMALVALALAAAALLRGGARCMITPPLCLRISPAPRRISTGRLAGDRPW